MRIHAYFCMELLIFWGRFCARMGGRNVWVEPSPEIGGEQHATRDLQCRKRSTARIGVIVQAIGPWGTCVQQRGLLSCGGPPIHRLFVPGRLQIRRHDLIAVGCRGSFFGLGALIGRVGIGEWTGFRPTARDLVACRVSSNQSLLRQPGARQRHDADRPVTAPAHRIAQAKEHGLLGEHAGEGSTYRQCRVPEVDGLRAGAVHLDDPEAAALQICEGFESHIEAADVEHAHRSGDFVDPGDQTWRGKDARVLVLRADPEGRNRGDRHVLAGCRDSRQGVERQAGGMMFEGVVASQELGDAARPIAQHGRCVAQGDREEPWPCGSPGQRR